MEIASLKGRAAASVWGELVEENCVIVAFFNVGREVGDSDNCKPDSRLKLIHHIPLIPLRILEMIVEPPK